MSKALDYISISGFKSIASIDRLELKPINVVIGPNGSGKSNFIGALSFLHAIRDGRLSEYVLQAGGAERVLHFGSKKTQELRLKLSFGGSVRISYEIVLSPNAEDALFVSSEAISCRTEDGNGYDVGLQRQNRGREAGISDSGNPSQQVGWVRHKLSGVRIYHIHDTSASSLMRKTAKVDDNAVLHPDGSNLAAFLYLLQQKHSESYGLIRSVIQRVAPFFDDFQLAPRRLQEDFIRLEWRHKHSDQHFDASSLSDGTLRFIVLATLLLQPRRLRPSVIIVDEPELGLHPYALELLSSLVRQASKETQVMLSTQSSLLLDHFDPQDVIVANRVDGATQLTRLDGKAYVEWLKEYSLGQLWEKNEIGGRPSPD